MTTEADRHHWQVAPTVDWQATNNGTEALDLYNRIKWCLSDTAGQCLGDDPAMSGPCIDPGYIDAGATVSGRTVLAVPEAAVPAWLACQRDGFGRDFESATVFLALMR